MICLEGKSGERAADCAPVLEMFPAIAGHDLQKLSPAIENFDAFDASAKGELEPAV